VNISDQFPEIEILLAQDGPESVLKERTLPPVPVIEFHHVSREKPSHESGNSRVACPEKEMGMIGHESPGQAGRPGFGKKLGHSLDQIVPVPVITEYLSTLDPPDDDMLKYPGRVQSGCSRHGSGQYHGHFFTVN